MEKTKTTIRRKQVRLWLYLISLTLLPASGERGAEIYRKHCASCHGNQGQGVADKYDEALIGKKSITSLTRYIHRSMPEDHENTVIDEDARLVATYIHAAFYSPEARVRLQPVKRDLLRRTRHQHRRAITDLVQSFRWHARMNDENGLRGHYFNKDKMNNRKTSLAKRLDPIIAFNLHKNHGLKNINPKAHSIYWSGSLLPPETGTYHFRILSPNGFRVFLNEPNRKKEAFIDAWVSSSNTMRTVEKTAHLLGAHPVPIFIEFVAYQEKDSSLVLEWKTPHGAWEAIPPRYLFTANSPKATLISTPFPPDDASLGYERGSTISKAWKEAVAKSAIEATSHIFSDIDELASTKPDDPKRSDMLKRFCEDFATRAFARPLSPAQKKHYLHDLFAAPGADHDTAAKRSLMLILTSPYFLYPSLNRNEKGQPDSYSVAAHLALTLWDSVPDQNLFKAASKNQLTKESDIRRRIPAMLQDPRAQIKIQRFFHQWLGLAEKENLEKDPTLFSEFSQATISDLKTSLDLFFKDVVWSESSDYRRLFTEEKIYLNPSLAKIYHPKKTGVSGFQLLPTPNQKRAGLFTHPFILSTFSYHKQTSPIHRGVYLSRNVLGRFLKPPPNAIEFKDADFKPHLTMREKVTEITKDKNCMACHSIINPIGFSLENFDAIGRFRTHEKGKAINPVSTYLTASDTPIKITGPTDLAKLAINSPTAHRAFIKHLFHHLIQQPVNAYSFEKMNHLHKSFTQSNFHIRNLITTIIVETSFPSPQGKATRTR